MEFLNKFSPEQIDDLIDAAKEKLNNIDYSGEIKNAKKNMYEKLFSLAREKYDSGKNGIFTIISTYKSLPIEDKYFMHPRLRNKYHVCEDDSCRSQNPSTFFTNLVTAEFLCEHCIYDYNAEEYMWDKPGKFFRKYESWREKKSTWFMSPREKLKCRLCNSCEKIYSFQTFPGAILCEKCFVEEKNRQAVWDEFVDPDCEIDFPTDKLI